MAETVREILIAAKALIPDEAHWWRGERGGHQCKQCPITAIASVSGGSGSPLAKLAFAWAAGLDSSMTVPDWNDNPERTLAEIHTAFDKAIAAESV